MKVKRNPKPMTVIAEPQPGDPMWLRKRLKEISDFERRSKKVVLIVR